MIGTKKSKDEQTQTQTQPKTKVGMMYAETLQNNKTDMRDEKRGKKEKVGRKNDERRLRNRAG